jgi:hypothetical protein
VEDVIEKLERIEKQVADAKKLLREYHEKALRILLDGESVNESR